MCRAARCRTCGKTTWAGCGQHVDMVRMSVPKSEWCGGKHTEAQLEAARAAKAEQGGGILARLFGR